MELQRKPAEIEALNKVVTPVTPKMKKYNCYTRYFCIIADFMRSCRNILKTHGMFPKWELRSCKLLKPAETEGLAHKNSNYFGVTAWSYKQKDFG